MADDDHGTSPSREQAILPAAGVGEPSVVWASWRALLRDRIARDEQAVRESERAEALPNIADEVRAALQEARCHARLQTERERPDWRRFLLSLVNGTPIESAWRAVHRAEEAMMLLLDDTAIRLEVPKLRGDLPALGLPDSDARLAAYKSTLTGLDVGPQAVAAAPVTDEERRVLRDLRTALDKKSDEIQGRKRALRNTQLAIAFVLTLVALLIGIAEHFWTSALALTPAGASAQGSAAASRHAVLTAANIVASAPGAGEVLVVGGLGGLLSAVVALGRLSPQRGPFGFAIVQALLKVPAGALTAYVVIVVMQHGVLGVIGPQSGDRVLGYAALFGFAQLAATQMLDRQAKNLSGDAGAKP